MFCYKYEEKQALKATFLWKCSLIRSNWSILVAETALNLTYPLGGVECQTLTWRNIPGPYRDRGARADVGPRRRPAHLAGAAVEGKTLISGRFCASSRQRQSLFTLTKAR